MKDLAGLLPFVLIALVFWLLIIRPQRRRQQALRATQSTLGLGSEVMLGSGIYGTVVSLGEDTLQIEVSPGARMKVARQAVVRVVEEQVAGDDRIEPERRDGDDGLPGSPGPQL